jgi:hypothetical protein
VKLDLVVPGGQYVCALKPKHILIPGTEITYLERYEQLRALDQNSLPRAAVEEYERLCEALGAHSAHKGRIYPSGESQGGLASRINRCEGVIRIYRAGKPGYRVGTPNIFFEERQGTIVTVVAKEPGRVTVEADFEPQTKLGFWGEDPCGRIFDPTIPELAEPDDDASDDEIAEWVEQIDVHGRDGAGTLRAIVHPAAIKSVYDDGLIDRLNAEHEEEIRRHREQMDERRKEIELRHAGRTVDKMIEDTLREAARPPDDEWEALA